MASFYKEDSDLEREEQRSRYKDIKEDGKRNAPYSPPAPRVMQK